MTLTQFIGAAIVFSTLGGGIFWLTDQLIIDHVSPRAQRPVAVLTVALACALLAYWLHQVVVGR